MNVMYDIVKILAKLELFAGYNMRQWPFSSKYRPIFSFSNDPWNKISGSIDLLNEQNYFEPGSTGIVQISFIKGFLNDSCLQPGQTFFISEDGSNNLGKGEVIEVFSEDS